jgi:Xaa-Pro dipeptidase
MNLVEQFRDRNLPNISAFSVPEYEDRLRRTRSAMAERGIDLLLVHNMANVCYLTGYETPMSDWYVCLFVPAAGALTLHACDVGLAIVHSWFKNIVWVRWDTMGLGATQLIDAVQGHGGSGKRVGLETRRPGLNVQTYVQLKKSFPDTDFVDATDVVSRLRIMKSSAELDCMRKAAHYTDAGISAAVAAARTGVTENDVAAAASEAMISAGSEYFSIDPLVRTGKRTSMAHATYRRNTVENGDPMILEMGGVHSRYTAPIYRTISIGPPSARLSRLAEGCLNALECLYEYIRPGRSFEDAARAAEKVLVGVDADAEVVPSCGYSVGLGFPPDWVEHSTFIRTGCEDVFQPGMVFHTPRSLRVPGVMSAGFSEAIVITANGCEPLSQLPRKLLIV